MTVPEQPEQQESSNQPETQASVPTAVPMPPEPTRTAGPESFAANVERLVAEGKLTEAEAAELLEPAHEPVAAASRPSVALSKQETETGGVPEDLHLEVAGYSLSVIHDPSLHGPQLSASQDGVLDLRSGPDGWTVKRLSHGWELRLRAVLSLPWSPRNVRAEVSGGSLTLPELRGVADLEVSGGNATLSAAAELRGEVSGGNLMAGEVSGELRLEVSGGNATVERASALRAEVNGGNLSWTGRLDTGNHSVEVNGGQATLRLSEASSVEVRAESTLGGVSASFPLRKSGGMMHATYHGLLGSGGARLKCEVNAGQIRLMTDAASGVGA